VLARNFTNSFRTREVIVTTKNTTANETSIGETAASDASSASSDSQSETQEGNNIEVTLRRDQHDLISLNPNQDRILVYKKKKASWKEVFGRRIGKGSTLPAR
jgi:hypothetical protein